MRIVAIAMLLSLWLGHAMHGQTLADILSAHTVPNAAFTQDDLRQSIATQDAMSVVFDAEMEPEGFGTEAKQAVHPETVHYVFRYWRGRWVPGEN